MSHLGLRKSTGCALKLSAKGRDRRDVASDLGPRLCGHFDVASVIRCGSPRGLGRGRSTARGLQLRPRPGAGVNSWVADLEPGPSFCPPGLLASRFTISQVLPHTGEDFSKTLLRMLTHLKLEAGLPHIKGPRK